MKYALFIIIICLLGACASPTKQKATDRPSNAASTASLQRKATDRPNVIIFFLDDSFIFLIHGFEIV